MSYTNILKKEADAVACLLSAAFTAGEAENYEVVFAIDRTYTGDALPFNELTSVTAAAGSMGDALGWYVGRGASTFFYADSYELDSSKSPQRHVNARGVPEVSLSYLAEDIKLRLFDVYVTATPGGSLMGFTGDDRQRLEAFEKLVKVTIKPKNT